MPQWKWPYMLWFRCTNLSVPSDKAVLGELECAAVFLINWWCFMKMISQAAQTGFAQNLSPVHQSFQMSMPIWCSAYLSAVLNVPWLQCISSTMSVWKAVQINCPAFVSHPLIGFLVWMQLQFWRSACVWNFDRTTNDCCFTFSYNILPFSAKQSTSISIKQLGNCRSSLSECHFGCEFHLSSTPMTTCCQLDNQALCAALSTNLAACFSTHDYSAGKPSARAFDTSISTLCLTYRGIRSRASTTCSIFLASAVDERLQPGSHLMVLSPLPPLSLHDILLFNSYGVQVCLHVPLEQFTFI